MPQSKDNRGKRIRSMKGGKGRFLGVGPINSSFAIFSPQSQQDGTRPAGPAPDAEL